MADSSVKKNFVKPFAHIRIKWTIRNFCLAARNAVNLIRSPEFVLKGDCLTKWRMILQIGAISSTTVPISFILERCPEGAQFSDTSDTVFVNCELIVKAGNKRFPDVENIFGFERKGKRIIHFPSLQSILENFKPFNADPLKIELNMIVRGDKYKYDAESPEGLLLLSKDLMNMFYNSMYHDITIVVDGNEIKAHKFMLNRINFFRFMLSKNPDADRNILRLRNVPFRNMHKFLEFIYTGNMIPMLNNPSLSMYKLLKDFSCDTLLCYYVPDRLSLNTTIEIEEASWFYWDINDFSHRNQEILSELYRGICSKVAWRMRLIPRFPSSNNFYISLFAEVLDYEKPRNTCLEFGLLDVHSFVKYSKRVINADMNDQNVGFLDFIDRHELESRSLVHDNDSIRIIFRPRILADKNTSSVVSRFSPTVTLPEMTRSHEELSADMGRLLGGNECDLKIVVGDETFYAHRGVIEARCSKLRGRLQRLQQWEPLTVQDSTVTAPIFRKLLDFIYRGILMDCEDEDLVHLSSAARSFWYKW